MTFDGAPLANPMLVGTPVAKPVPSEATQMPSDVALLRAARHDPAQFGVFYQRHVEHGAAAWFIDDVGLHISDAARRVYMVFTSSGVAKIAQ